MEIGFSGSRQGMTDAQIKQIRLLLIELKPEKCHHGDCVGADSDFHLLCEQLGIPIRIHPPVNPKARAFSISEDMADEKEYLERNRDIVTETKLLLATPKEVKEQQRGGTWYTIRYARTMAKFVIIVYPSGTLEDGLNADC